MALVSIFKALYEGLNLAFWLVASPSAGFAVLLREQTIHGQGFMAMNVVAGRKTWTRRWTKPPGTTKGTCIILNVGKVTWTPFPRKMSSGEPLLKQQEHWMASEIANETDYLHVYNEDFWPTCLIYDWQQCKWPSYCWKHGIVCTAILTIIVVPGCEGIRQISNQSVVNVYNLMYL